MKRYWTCAICGLAILAADRPGLGRVFRTSRTAGIGPAVFETTAGWKRLHQTPMRINGGRGELEVFGCDEPLAAVMSKLKRAYGTEGSAADFKQTDTMGWALIHDGESVTRILVLDTLPTAQSMLFVLNQSRAEYEKSLSAPAEHQLTELPVFPGSVAQSYIEAEATRTRLEVSVAAAPAAAVSAFFDSALAQSGWQPMPPGLPPGQPEAAAGAGQFAIYQKGPEICCILAQASAQSAESTITMLHKRLRME